MAARPLRLTERDHLMKSADDRQLLRKYPEPLTLSWRRIHFVNYIIGGICFFFGSMFLFYFMQSYTASAAFFTVGSFTFLVADSMEWWTNNRIGCFNYEHCREDYEAVEGRYYGEQHSCWGSWKRMEKGLNFFFSATGSCGYLIGSVVFFPQFGLNDAACYIFIFSSLIIFLSQSWKVSRQGCSNAADLRDNAFRLSNYSSDILALGVDAFAGLGGLWYMIGSYFFLSQVDTSSSIALEGTVFFVFGGAFFSASGIFMFCRYFVSDRQW